MIHLPDASVDLAAVVGPVGFPCLACAAVPRPPVCITNENVLAVESLQAGAVRVVIWPGFVRLRLDIIGLRCGLQPPLPLPLTPPLPPLIRCTGAEGDNAGIEGDYEEQPYICSCNED